MNQKEAVFQAVSNITGHTEGKCEPTTEQRKQIMAVLIEGFKAGKIDLDKEFTDPELKVYVSGLLSNWLRKDTRLNGGEKYVTKNPGSRAGAGDPTLKAMMALLSIQAQGSPEYIEVQDEIIKYKATLAETKAKAIVVNYQALPEHLRNKFSK
jgi:hypothetical protein